MAKKKMLGTLLMCVLLSLFLVQYAGAQYNDVMNIEAQQTITAFAGNDFVNLTAFNVSGDLLYAGSPLGTISWTMTGTDLPIDYQNVFEEYELSGTLDVTGFGTCPLNGYLYATGTSAVSFNIMFSYSAFIGPCTGSLDGLVGVISGSGENHVDAATFMEIGGAADIVIQIRPQ